MGGKELMVGRRTTKETRMVEQVMNGHFPNHPPQFPPCAYRYNSASIRLRIVDRSFRRTPWFDRLDLVQRVLKSLPEKTQQDIIFVVLLTPEEIERSPANYEFEHPSPQPRLSFGSRSSNNTDGAKLRPRRKRRGARP